MVDTMIRLFETTATVFTTNGLGSMPDASSCEVVEERNGEFELEMTYHISGKRYSELKLRRILVVKPNSYANPQPFRIYEISKPINGLVTIKAEHIRYDMSGYPVSPFKAGTVSSALSSLASNSIVNQPFEFTTDLSANGELSIDKPTSMSSLLGGNDNSILEIYGGEYEFDRYKVTLHSDRGNDNGVTIRYGKNMTDLTQEENCNNVYTAVYPFWYSDEWGLIELPEKTIATPGTYDYTKIYPLDLSSDWENTNEWEDEYPSEDEIRDLANKYIEENELGVPVVSLTVSFEQLSQSKEYATMGILEGVHLCDIVHIEFPALGVSAISKCIKTTYNVLTGKYSSIELGEAKSNLADSIASTNAKVDDKINERPTKGFMSYAVDKATQLISGGLGGYVVIRSSSDGSHPDEILIMDTDDIKTASKVWRWNKGGLGYSPHGYNGPYSTAITQDGEIVADFVKTGHMMANIIQGGTLTVGGFDNIDGAIEIRDRNNRLLIGLDVNGIQFYGDGDSSITSIVKDTVTTSYINALSVKAGSVDAENITGTTISGKTLVAGGNENGIIEVRDSNGALLIQLSTSGIQFYGDGDSSITSIVKDTVTTSYINALSVKAGSVDAKNITGTTISGKTFSGCKGEFTGNVNANKMIANNAYYICDADFDTNIRCVSSSPDDTSDTKLNFGRLTKNNYSDYLNYISFSDKSQSRYCDIYSGTITLHGTTRTTNRIYSHGAVAPDDDEGHPCGLSNMKWSTVYAKNGSINTSDKNKKHDIKEISEVYEKLFFGLNPVSYMFNNGDRVHIGIIAQDLENLMGELGLSDIDVAGYCRDIKMKITRDDLTGNVIEEPDLDENGNIQYNYGVRYSEFIMLNTHMLQKAYKRIDELKVQLEEVLTYLREKE